MADPATPPTPAPATEPAPTTSPEPPANTVPYERFKEVNDKANSTAAELAELRQWKEEQEAKSLSEVERERKRAEAAEKTAQEAEQRVTSLERGGWVRAAAMEAGFLDPSDAVQFIDLADVETETQAKNAVKRLAENKQHLLRPTEDKPALTRVLQANGETPKPGDPAGDPKEALGEGILNFLANRG